MGRKRNTNRQLKMAAAKRNQRRGKKRLQVETLEPRQMLASDLVLAAVQSSDGTLLEPDSMRFSDPGELTFIFNSGVNVDSSSLDGVEFVRSGGDGDFSNGNEVVIEPGFIGIGDAANELVVRFSESLPDDEFVIRNAASTPEDCRITFQGADLSLGFDLDLGARVLSVVPQPVTVAENGTVTQARNQIEIYFNNDELDLSSATNPDFYQLIHTGHRDQFQPDFDTVTSQDDSEPVLPTNVEYDSTANKVTLTFASDIADLPSGEGTYRLRIGTSEPQPLEPIIVGAPVEPGDTIFTASTALGTLSSQPRILEGLIDPSESDDGTIIIRPGGNNDPGHRAVNSLFDQHVTRPADTDPSITTLNYNFRTDYGMSGSGQPLRNQISPVQQQRVREVLELYSHYLGVQFVETADQGLTFATGDVRAVLFDATGRDLDLDDDGVADITSTDPDIVPGIAGRARVQTQFGFEEIDLAVLNGGNNWSEDFGESFFVEAMRQTGFLLGLGASEDLPLGTIMGGDPALAFDNIPGPDEINELFVAPEIDFSDLRDPVFPGSNDIIHGQHLYKPDSNDIDLYRFEIPEDGTFSAETFAHREGSSVDTVLRLFRRTPDGAILVSQNDDAFGNDSQLDFEVTQGTYYIGVSAKGNIQYDPTYRSGANGVSSGTYRLRVDFDSTVDNSLVDTTGRRLDGDGDGVEGGIHNFWFRSMDESKTLFVNKAANAGGDGSTGAPFDTIQAAVNSALPGEIVRVVGNNVDNIPTNDEPYEIGFDSLGNPLPDGGGDGILRVPNGVTLMVDAGSVFKMQRGAILVGSESFVTNANGGAIQVLGTPEASVQFTSFNDASIGVDTNPLNQPARRGDWGGIQIRHDIDDASGNFNYEDQGIFLDTVNFADMRYGGGVLQIASVARVVNPVTLIDTRATVTNNNFELNADAAIAATPNSFKETNFLSSAFQTVPFTPDYDRVGPEIDGNSLRNNTINGLFVVDRTSNQTTGLELTVSARWDDTDIVHVLANNLTIAGQPGGLLLNSDGVLVGRESGRLEIDPGTVVKLDGGRFEVGLGASMTAEGEADKPVVFTSIQDDRYGFGGTFDTNNDIDAPVAGDWAGIMALPTSRVSFDHSIFAYGGGTGTIEGGFASFNTLEIIQADARVTNSTFEFNDRGDISAVEGNRNGRGANEEGTIFVRGAQPIVVGNVFFSNASAAVNINVDSLNWHGVTDFGRMSGPADVIEIYQDNQGPLVRNNIFDSNGNNGMIVRGGTLTTESVWDDTDIVHVLHEGVYVPNFHSYGGLRLRSSQTESLVVKLSGELAGFITTGTANGTADHIGGSMQIIGQPGNPVVLTSYWDDTVGAGRDLFGNTQTDTNGGGRPVRTAAPGSDNSLQIELNFGPNIQANPEAMEAAQLAANIWMEQLQDPIEISIDVDLADIGGADLADTETFPGAGLLNALNRYNLDEVLFDTTVQFVEQAYDSVRSRLIQDAGEHETLLSQLPTSNELNVRFPGNVPVEFGVQNIELTRANAKAINLGLGSANRVQSAYNADVDAIDGTILISDNPDVFDFDLTDGLKSYREDFQTHFLREIGSVLGFTSGLDNITAQLQTGQVDPEPSTADIVEVAISPLDLFRFAPGDGVEDFKNGERLLDPQLSEHVFFAGGNQDFREYPYEGITVGDIPLSTGLRRGDELNDIYTAASWHDEEFFRNSRLYQFDTIGVMDPVSIHRDEVIAANDTFVQEHGLVIDITESDRLAFDSIGYDVVGGTPGDWAGIRIEELSYDGNVEYVLEAEAPSTAAPGTNALPATAQFLGSLAPNRNAGNEELRLAFEVHGLINEDNDVDVYSFTATAGTEVWLDLDQTGSTLDSVLELIDGNTVITRSDNSASEAQGAVDLLGIGQTFVDPTGDIYTSNLNDAGLRVVLPGPAGLESTYFVRVRSSSNNLNNVSGGDSNGRYELQVRLRERDEVPGTTVQYSNIHFAQTGVEIVGPPSDSPLVGEHVEDESINDLYGDTIATALNDEGFVVIDQSFGTADFPFAPNSQDLGNILASRQGATSVFGALEGRGDVDWYRFGLGYNDLALQAAFSEEVGVVFDIDYADGLGRPDTKIAVYRETFGGFGGGFGGIGDPRLELLYYSDDSNLALDQTVDGGPDAIDGGSFGTGDPFIGPVTLDATIETGQGIVDSAIFDFESTYYVAVTAANMTPIEIVNGDVELTPVLGNEQRGFVATQVFDPTDPFGLDTAVSTFVPEDFETIEGEYQLEIRIAPTQDTIQLGPLDSDTNRERVQGQIVIANNEILNSRTFGVSIVDNLRDQPTYGGILSENQTIIPNYFNTSTFRQPHGQFTHGDYVPHSGGIPRALPNLNEERVIPGITVSNNVIASNFEGGIEVQGDPGGMVLHTYDLSRLCTEWDDFDADDFDQARFAVWDHHGNSNMFEFTTDGTTIDGAIPIRVDCGLPDVLIIDTGTFQSTENFPTVSEFVADEMEHAFRLSDLDIKVFRAEGFSASVQFETGEGEFEDVTYTTPESFFLEGAIEIGIADVGNGRDPWILRDITVPIITSQIAPQGAVVSPRIVNNTIVGRGGDLFNGNGTGDVGVLMEDNSSPTLVNNIVANFKTGIEADLTSNDSTQERRTFVGNDFPIDQQSFITELPEADLQLFERFRFNFAFFGDTQLTMRNIDEAETPYLGARPSIVGATVYQGNLNDSLRIGVGDFALNLNNTDPLFVDAADGNYFLQGSTFDSNGNLIELGSRAIDSSINEVEERDYLAETSSSIGIQTTPIRSPSTDSIGVLRIDDPFIEPPDGLGSNVFKDRGALERADFVGPTATVTQPLDNDSAGNDRDATLDSVVVFGELLTSFDIQLSDGASQVDPVGGSGIDDTTLLIEGAIIVRRDGVELTRGVDYQFAYDQTNDTIRVVPLEGVWRTGATYEIQLLNGNEGILDNLGNTIQILDRSGNPLQPNQVDGTTRYSISLDSGADFGDAPSPYPSQLSDDGARHTLSEGFFLGSGVTVEGDAPAMDAGDDGVSLPAALLRGSSVTVAIAASGPGFINGWIDWNQDGVWAGSSEQVLNGQAVTVGTNNFTFDVPSNAAAGTTYARFRLSTEAGLQPTGLAEDGEVEDYAVSVGDTQWRNAENPLDVNGDGSVSPIDALTVINEFNGMSQFSDPTTGALDAIRPEDAPFLDVNGDGFVSPLDALLVINGLGDPAAAAPVTNDGTEQPRAASGLSVDDDLAMYDMTTLNPSTNKKLQTTATDIFDSIFADEDDAEDLISPWER